MKSFVELCEALGGLSEALQVQIAGRSSVSIQTTYILFPGLTFDIGPHPLAFKDCM
jgi:hypothetical protein